MKELKLVVDEFLPLRDVVFKALRDAIVNGDLKPGERLMEIQLANKMGVSRTPVREAIRKLELEGLVIMTPRKGAQVAPITEDDLTDVLEVRKALERLAVDLACDKITEETLDKLKEETIKLKIAIKNNDINEIAKKDVEFHDIIYDSTGNKRLVQMINNLREHIFRYRIAYIKDVEQRTLLIEEHSNIVESIINKDKESAINAMVRHIDNQEKFILENIKNETEEEE